MKSKKDSRVEILKNETSHLLEAFAQSISASMAPLESSVVSDDNSSKSSSSLVEYDDNSNKVAESSSPVEEEHVRKKAFFLKQLNDSSTEIDELASSPAECLQFVQSHLQQLRDECNKMESHLCQAHLEKKKLEERQSKLNKKLQSDLDNARDEIEKLNAKIVCKKNAKQRFLTKFDNLSQKLWIERDGAQKKVESIEKKFAHQSKELEEAKEKMEKISVEKILVLQIQIDSITKQRDSTLIDAKKATAKYKESDAIITGLRGRVRDLEDNEEATNVKLIKFKRELDSASKKRFDVSLDNKTLKQKVKTLESALKDATKKNDDLEEENAKAMEREKENRLKLTSQKLELEYTQKECTDLKLYLTNLEYKLKQTEVEQNSLEISLQQIKKICKKRTKVNNT